MKKKKVLCTATPTYDPPDRPRHRVHGLEGDDLGPGRVRAAQHLPEVGGVVVPEDVLGDAAVADALQEKTNKIETIVKRHA